MKLWTTLLRPLWTLRNSTVHAPNGYAPSRRLLLDMQQEVRELYSTTDPSSLHPHDQNLFLPSIDTILDRTYYQMQAWCTSVELAIKSAADSLRHNNDPNQTTIPFLPNIPTEEVTPPRRQPLQTPQKTPNLTPVTRRILRRRLKKARTQAIITPPPSYPSTNKPHTITP